MAKDSDADLGGCLLFFLFPVFVGVIVGVAWLGAWVSAWVIAAASEPLPDKSFYALWGCLAAWGVLRALYRTLLKTVTEGGA